MLGRLNFAGILKGGGRVAVGVAVDGRLPKVRVGGGLGVFPEGKADALGVRVATPVAVADTVAARAVGEPEGLMAGLPVSRQGLRVCVELVLGEGDTEELREAVGLTEGERVPAMVRDSEGTDVDDALGDGHWDAAAERLGVVVTLSREEALTEGVIDVLARGEAVEEALRDPDPEVEMVLFTEKEMEGLPEDVFEAETLCVGVERPDKEGDGLVVYDEELREVLVTLRERTEGVAVELRERCGEKEEQGLGRGVRESVVSALKERVTRGLLVAPAREPDAERVGFDTDGPGVPVTDAVFVDVRVTVPEGALVTVPPLTLRKLVPEAEAEPDSDKIEAVLDGVVEGVLTGAVRVGVAPEDWQPDQVASPERDVEGEARMLPEALREPAPEAVLQAEVLAVLDPEVVPVALDDAVALTDTEKLTVTVTDEVVVALRPLSVAFAEALALTVPVFADEGCAEVEALTEEVLSPVAAAEEVAQIETVGEMLLLTEPERDTDVHGDEDVETDGERVKEGDAEVDAFKVMVAQLAEGDSEGVMVCVSERDAVDVEEGDTEVVASHLSDVSAIWSQMPPVSVAAQKAPPGLLLFAPPVWHQ